MTRPDVEDLAGGLEEFLRREWSAEVTVADLERLTGGASRETWSLSIDGERHVLQRERPGAVAERSMHTEAVLLGEAQRAGVPVAELRAHSTDPQWIGAPFLVSRFVEGETIARRILRDDAFADARAQLAANCGRALAAVHAIDPSAVPGLEPSDELARYREVLDLYGDPHPAFELAFRWLADHRPDSAGRSVVHGDFRLGNLMVGPDGLRAVVDWELAHVGDPMEDLGWLCVRAWRFGGAQPVAGVGSYGELFDAYEAASGRPVDPAVVRWWEVLGTLKWGIMCIMQARAHLDGHTRSLELAAIGRRACENEHDLLLLLAPGALEAAEPPSLAQTPAPGLHDRPSATELVEALRGWVEDDVSQATTGRVRFHSRVAANVLGILDRELRLGPDVARRHRERLSRLGYADEAALAAAVRDGEAGLGDAEVVGAMAATVVDKLAVANPRWFPS